MSEQIAINLIKEAKSTFIESFCKLDDDLKARLSLYDIDRLFETLVYPAIERVRHIERFADEPEKINPPLNKSNIVQVMNDIVKNCSLQRTIDKNGNIVK